MFKLILLIGIVLLLFSRYTRRLELGNILTKVSLFILTSYSTIETVIGLKSLKIYPAFWNKIFCAITVLCTTFFASYFIISLAGYFDRDDEEN